MNIFDLKPTSDEIVVTLKDPRNFEETLKNSDGTDMTWTLFAPHTKEHKEAMYTQTDARIKKMSEDGKVEVTKFTARDLDEAALELYVSTTKSLNIDIDETGKKATVKQVRKLLEELFWIKLQLDEGLETFEVFTKP